MSGRACIAVTRRIPEAGLALLREAEAAGEVELRLWEEEMPPSPEQLAELLRGCTGALTLLTDKINGEVLDREPGLKVVSNFAVGYDNVDVPAATARGVAVCNTPDALTETTADFAWALMMASARRIVEGVDYVRAGKWKTWGPTLLLGRDLWGATLGIVGFGRIGREMAKRARGFEMTTLAYDTYQDEQAARDLGATYRPLDDVLRESDFVTLHVALTKETHHLIGARELGLMKREAILVNAARGPVVDTDALGHGVAGRDDLRRRARRDRPGTAAGRPPAGRVAERDRRAPHRLGDGGDAQQDGADGRAQSPGGCSR